MIHRYLWKAALLISLPVVVSGSPAFSQDEPSGNRPMPARSEPFKQALPFLRITAVVADHVHHRSLSHYVGLYVSPEDWASASNDSWIGPFFKIKYAKPKPGRSAACVFSSEKDIALCVYFDGETPFGLATVKVGVSGRIDPYRVASSYEGLAKRLLKASEQKLDFIPTAAATDDGRPLPAFELRKQQGS